MGVLQSTTRKSLLSVDMPFSKNEKVKKENKINIWLFTSCLEAESDTGVRIHIIYGWGAVRRKGAGDLEKGSRGSGWGREGSYARECSQLEKSFSLTLLGALEHDLCQSQSSLEA